MDTLLKAIARYLDRSDTGDIVALIFVGAMCLGGVLCALGAVIHGFH